jgi:hypothetical protein
MSSIFFKFNQRAAWFRVSLLVCLLALVTAAWYISIENRLLLKIYQQRTLRAQLEESLVELQTLSSAKQNYIYSTDLEVMGLQNVLQGLASNINGLVMSDMIDQGKTNISGGYERFSLAAGELGVHLLPQLSQHKVTLKFQGSFKHFLKYLQALQTDTHQIYFESVDFTMNVFPKADITLTVFTLGEP